MSSNTWRDVLERQIKDMRERGATNEDVARHYASNARWLRERLDSAKAALNRDYRAMFDHCTFDFANRRLVGNRGYALQWLPRAYPDAPINAMNQQTSTGVVRIVNLQEASNE